MTRVLLLAALALACVASPAFAMAYPTGQEGAAVDLAFGLTVLGLCFVRAGALFLLWIAPRRPIPLALAALVGVLWVGSAVAVEVVATPPTVVSAEWGPYLEVLLRWLSAAALPLLAAMIGGYLFRTYPMLRMILSEEVIERTLSTWADHGINATAGAAKGKTLDMNVGSEAFANMLRRG
jgi:hypothetical protein